MTKHPVPTLGLWCLLLLVLSTCTFDENDPQFRREMAIETAKEFVIKRLKAPATAEWPRGSAYNSCNELGYNRYRVTSFMDAKNIFGAKIRTHFVAVVRYEGKGRWSLESLEMRP